MRRVYVATAEGPKPALSLLERGQWAVTREDDARVEDYGATHLPSGFAAYKGGLGEVLRAAKALGEAAPAFDMSTYSDDTREFLRALVRMELRL